MAALLDFYKNKRILLTGHTGFKGAWLSKVLLCAGAEVTGYALPAEPGSLSDLLGLAEQINFIEGDIRDLGHLQQVFQTARPEIVFHLAAQPLVRESYRDPVGTYSTNVMGTVNLLECVRTCDRVRSVVNITTDKVYDNQEWSWGYRETDRLGGYDPYAGSKACSELVTQSYIHSFLQEQNVAVSTARAGNVIGGGDLARDRIIPDCIRAVKRGQPILLRNPNSVRPYQHVLEPLSAYLLIAKVQYEDRQKSGAYNIGPLVEDCLTTKALAEAFCSCWGDGARWYTEKVSGPHESGCLRLDCSLVWEQLGWRPQWNIQTAVERTVEWTKAVDAGQDARIVTDRQIQEYFDNDPSAEALYG